MLSKTHCRTKIQDTLYSTNNKEKDYMFISLNYIKNTNVNVKNLLSKFGIKAVEVNKTNLPSLFVNNKLKVNKLEKVVFRNRN